MAASVQGSAGAFESGSPVPLFKTRILGGGADIGLGRQYDVAPDGRFLINSIPEEDAPTPITLLLNWHPPADGPASAGGDTRVGIEAR